MPITFLNAALLFGMALGGVPVIIHLLNRRRFKRIIWAAMEWLLAAVEKNARRLRLEDLILMVLRAAILILLAVALARPVATQALLAALGTTSTGAVIILDNSYSMDYKAAGQSHFDEAKKAALEIIQGLGKGSSVSLLLASDRPVALIREPTYDLVLAKEITERAELSWRPTAFRPTIKLAVRILSRMKTPRKEVYLISDCQKTAWDGLSKGLARELAALSSLARVYIIKIGQEKEENIAICALKGEEQVVSVDRPMRVTVEVANLGKKERKDLALSLLVDGRKVASRIITLSPGQSRPVYLYHRFKKKGIHCLKAKIDCDFLTADDTRYLTVNCREALRVLCVDGDPGALPFSGEVDYLALALSPEGPEAGRHLSIITPQRITQSELSQIRFSDYDIVVLANVSALSATQAGALRSYVEAGGGLLITLGERIEPVLYNTRFGGKKDTLLPARARLEQSPLKAYFSSSYASLDDVSGYE